MKTKFFFASVKSIDAETRQLEAVASTTEKDRDGEVILPSSMVTSLDSFKANPVILATHQHRLSSGSSPVIGSALPESIKINDNDVTFTMKFATTALGEEYWNLYKDGHMKAFSIGFIPLKSENRPEPKTGKSVLTYTEIELLEISAVPVPSNRRALARAKGIDEDDTDLKAALESEVSNLKSELSNLKSFIESQFDDIKTLLISDSEKLAEGLLLGGPHESVDSQGDKVVNSEQFVRALETAIKQVNER